MCTFKKRNLISFNKLINLMIPLIKKKENNSKSIKPFLVLGKKPQEGTDQWAKNKPYLISRFPFSFLRFFFPAVALYIFHRSAQQQHQHQKKKKKKKKKKSCSK